jgi:hypothetical protein
MDLFRSLAIFTPILNDTKMLRMLISHCKLVTFQVLNPLTRNQKPQNPKPYTRPSRTMCQG